MRWIALLSAVALSGCMTAPLPEPQTQPQALGIIFDHDEMVAAMEGQYLWDCTMEDGITATDETFRFVIARRVFDGQSVLTLEEAGRDLVEDVEPDPATGDGRDIYVLQDFSRLFIEADGLAYGGGVTQSRLARFTMGRCTRGDQR